MCKCYRHLNEEKRQFSWCEKCVKFDKKKTRNGECKFSNEHCVSMERDNITVTGLILGPKLHLIRWFLRF